MNYQGKILLAALDIARNDSQRGYEFYCNNGDLILIPITNREATGGGYRMWSKLRVSNDKITGDEGFSSELEKRAEEL